MTEPDSWEDFEHLTLQPSTDNAPEEETTRVGESKEEAAEHIQENQEEEESSVIDQALKEALKNARERANVLRIEADVAKFVADKTRCTIEFSYDLTSYQVLRLTMGCLQKPLYGLQTSSIPLGNGLSRVIAHKTQETKLPPVRVIDVKDIYKPPEAEKTVSPPDVVIKKRQGAAVGRLPRGSGGEKGQDGGLAGGMTVKQREEEYKVARERILGTEVEQKGDQVTEEGTIEESEEEIKNRKAVFRDKVKEQQDPDYKRGSNRFQPPVAYDSSPYGEGKSNSGVYNVPTYNSEFPALPGAIFRPPPTTGNFQNPSTDPQRSFPIHGQMNYGATVMNRPHPPPPPPPHLAQGGARVPGPHNQFPLAFPAPPPPPPSATGPYPYPPRGVPFRMPNHAVLSGANTRPQGAAGGGNASMSSANVWNARSRPGTVTSTPITATPPPAAAGPALMGNPRMYRFPPHPAFPGYPPGYPTGALPPPLPPPTQARAPFFPMPPSSQVGGETGNSNTVGKEEEKTTGSIRRKSVTSTTDSSQT